MKQLVLVGILAGALTGVAWAQAATGQSQPAKKTTAKRTGAPEQAAAGGQLLGTIHLTRAVKANDQPLPAGTYQVRLSDEEVKPAAGTAPGSERWVEFVQGGQVKGKEIASVVPNSEVQQIAEDKKAPPPAGKPRVEMLKQEKYVRVWISKGGNSYLIHLPPA